MSIYRHLTTISLVFIAFGCGLSTNSKPTILISNLKSYSNFEHVKTSLKLDHRKWIVVEDSRNPSEGNRPSFNYYKIEIYEHTDLGINGSLILDFYNDRLINTWFFPSEVEKYKKLFEENSGFQLTGEWKVKIQPNTIVREGKDYKNRYYVVWIDKALNDEKIKRQS